MKLVRFTGTCLTEDIKHVSHGPPQEGDPRAILNPFIRYLPSNIAGSLPANAPHI